MKRTVLALTLATGIVVGGVSGYLIGTQDQDTHQWSERIVLTENTADDPQDRKAQEDLVQDLLDRGWYGIPSDGCECLYPPKT